MRILIYKPIRSKIKLKIDFRARVQVYRATSFVDCLSKRRDGAVSKVGDNPMRKKNRSEGDCISAAGKIMLLRNARGCF